MLHNHLKTYNFFKFVRKLRGDVPLNNFKPKFVAFFVAAGMAFSSNFCISSVESSRNLQFFHDFVREEILFPSEKFLARQHSA